MSDVNIDERKKELAVVHTAVSCNRQISYYRSYKIPAKDSLSTIFHITVN